MREQSEIRDTDWRQPLEEQEGLKRYVETIRERIWLIFATVVITTGIAVLYVFTATKMYDADAALLVTPVTGDNPVFASLGLLRESSDPTRDVQTASQLVTNVEIAGRVKKALDSGETPEVLLSKVTAEPVAQSSIVSVVARDTSPDGAADLANAFARTAVANRTDRMLRQIDDQLPRLRAQASEVSGTATENPVADQIALMEVLRSGPDPTIRLETPATMPTRQASPRPVLSAAGALMAGLILGLGAAFAFQVLDPRLRREAQLRRLYRLPILARIPKEQGRSAEKPLSPRRVSPVTAEAYRTLRATLMARESTTPGRARTILVTGSSPSEGKTTTAVNLATSLALSGKRVILIESDLRRPVLGDVLDVHPEHGGVVSVLIENTTLDQALTPTPGYGSNLQLLLADYEGGWITELFSIPAADRLLEEARGMTDYVIIDSPPLNEVVDALPLARQADDVLIVARIGTTRLDKLARLGELLAESGVRPVGFTVVGTERPRRGEYHYYEAAVSEEQGVAVG
ncbi:MAG: Wzz/FepE/Etk N-terminal domain-containing protein [Actinomycetota bacterium]